MTEITYPMPYSHLVTGADLAPLVVTLDGGRMPLAEWKTKRVSAEEYWRLMAVRRGLPGEPEYEEHP